MLLTTRLERYSGNGLVAKRNSQNFGKFSEHGAATCPCNCRAISKSFSDTLSEMTPNISDIKQKIRTMSEKKKNTAPFAVGLEGLCPRRIDPYDCDIKNNNVYGR